MKEKDINRRNFLRLAGIGSGAAVFACSGLGYAAVHTPMIDYIEFESSGDRDMEEKILITYASKAGSTGEIAQALADTLEKQGFAVDLKLIKNAGDISEYGTVIIGSAIRMGAWLPEAVDFVKNNQQVLSQKQLAYFVVSGVLRDQSPEKIQEVSAYLDAVRQVLEPQDIGLFAGVMDFTKLSFLDRTIAKMVKSVEGDFRDWDAINTWAEQYSKKIGQVAMA